MPQVGLQHPQLLIDVLDFLQERGVDGDSSRRRKDGSLSEDGHNDLLARRQTRGEGGERVGRPCFPTPQDRAARDAVSKFATALNRAAAVVRQEEPLGATVMLTRGSPA